MGTFDNWVSRTPRPPPRRFFVSTDANKSRRPAPQRGKRMPVPARIFTPDESADIRHSYVETDEPLDSIARRYRTSVSTLARNIRAWGWPRRRQTVRREMAQVAPAPVAPTPPAPTPEDEAAAADIEATAHRA